MSDLQQTLKEIIKNNGLFITKKRAEELLNELDDIESLNYIYLERIKQIQEFTKMTLDTLKMFSDENPDT
jgi:hypothetical protein